MLKFRQGLSPQFIIIRVMQGRAWNKEVAKSAWSSSDMPLLFAQNHGTQDTDLEQTDSLPSREQQEAKAVSQAGDAGLNGCMCAARACTRTEDAGERQGPPAMARVTIDVERGV